MTNVLYERDVRPIDPGTSFTTKGDANDTVDAAPVRAVQVKGRVWYSVPYLGHVNDVLGADQRQLAVTVTAVGLFVYAVTMFTGSVRDRRRGATADPDLEATS